MRLRRIDASVTRRAVVSSLTLGIVGSLILDTGMSLVMTDLGNAVGMNNGILVTVLGISVGVLGGILASLAYPVYILVIKARRNKIAPEILRLTDELIK